MENREAVLEALQHGQCDGILPAARGFLDGFAGFLLEAGILEAMEQFPDPRQRLSIPIFFFCNTLLGFYLQETDAAEQVQTLNRAPPDLPFPERELAVYAGDYFALLLPSELLEIILTHIEAWKANQANLLLALRHCEGSG